MSLAPTCKGPPHNTASGRSPQLCKTLRIHTQTAVGRAAATHAAAQPAPHASATGRPHAWAGVLEQTAALTLAQAVCTAGSAHAQAMESIGGMLYELPSDCSDRCDRT